MNYEIIVSYAHKNNMLVDASEVYEVLTESTQALFYLHKDGLHIYENLDGDYHKPFNAPNPLQRPDKDRDVESIHFELTNIIIYLKSIEESTEHFLSYMQQKNLSAENMMRIFSFCNHTRSVIREQQAPLILLKKLLDESNVHLNPVIISRLLQEKKNIKI